MPPKFVRLLCGAALVIGAVLFTTALDWPTYLNDVQRDGASTDTTLSTSNASQLTLLWSYKTGGAIAAQPIEVGGVVYLGSWDGYEYALNATTGAVMWKTFLGITTTSVPQCGPEPIGVTSSPTVQNGVVYVGGGDAYWYALNASTGAVLWKVYTGDNSQTGGHYNWASPLIYNGYAYIGIASLGDCPLVDGQLLQVSLTTHQIVNTLDTGGSGQPGAGIWTSPTLDTATNTIFVTTGTIVNYATQPLAQAMIAVDATTLAVKSVWQLPQAQAVTDADWGTTPTLFTNSLGHQLVAATNKNGFTYAYNRSNVGSGAIWQTQIATGGACPACGAGSVSSGAFGGGRLYIAGGNTTINGVSFQGSVDALNPSTGAFLWQHGTNGIVLAASDLRQRAAYRRRRIRAGGA